MALRRIASYHSPFGRKDPPPGRFREQAQDWESLPNWWPAVGQRPQANPHDVARSAPCRSRNWVHIRRDA